MKEEMEPGRGMETRMELQTETQTERELEREGDGDGRRQRQRRGQRQNEDGEGDGEGDREDVGMEAETESELETESASWPAFPRPHPLAALPAWLSPSCLLSAFPLFLGFTNTSLNPVAPFVLTEHPRSSHPAHLLHGAVLPACLFPAQAQRAQTESEFPGGLGRLSRPQEGQRGREAGAVSRPARGSRPRYTHPQFPVSIRAPAQSWGPGPGPLPFLPLVISLGHQRPSSQNHRRLGPLCPLRP